jgi:subtilisin family serine protease
VKRQSIVAACILLNMLVGGLWAVMPSTAESDPLVFESVQYALDHFIIVFTFEPPLTTNSVKTGYSSTDRLIARFRIDRIEPLFNLNHGDVVQKRFLGMSRVFVAHVSSQADLENTVAAFAADPNVEYAFLDPVLRGLDMSIPDDKCFGQQWSLHNTGQFEPAGGIVDADIDAPEAWRITAGDADVVIGVVDTGVDLAHSDLVENLQTNSDELHGIAGFDDDGNGFTDDVYGWDFVNGDPVPLDDKSHGTFVAGVAAARANNGTGIAGICGRCQILAVKVLDDGGSGLLTWVANGIEYAADNGADIINLSIGGRFFDPIDTLFWNLLVHPAVEYAYGLGKVLIAASGNDGSDPIDHPARFSEVIGVGSTDWADHRSSFSNFGNELELVAPGSTVLGTPLGGLDEACANFGSGTSFATPHVSGIVGLLLSVDPGLSPDQVRQILQLTADDQVGSPSEDEPGWDPYFGYGRVNAHRALLALLPRPVVTDVSYGHIAANGRYFEISTSVTNAGHVSDAGALTLSFPALTDPTDGQRVDIVHYSAECVPRIVPHGDLIRDRYGNDISADWLLVECVDDNWEEDEEHILTVRIYPPDPVPFTFHVRSAMGYQGYWTNYPSGPQYDVDQQGWEVLTYVINVPQIYIPLVMRGH